MRKEIIYLLIVILVGVIGGVVFFISGNYFLKSKKEERQKNIINCLNVNNIKLYISSDCEFCQQQKEIFGDYLDRIKIIECRKNGKWSDVCSREKINSVPMWVFPSTVKSVKINLMSCIDCQRVSGGILCEDYCYTKSEDGKWFRVSGFLNLDKLDEIFECSYK